MAITIESKENLKYRIKCEYCLTTFTYEQEDIGFRPWYPKGFVYCPSCNKPLRHDAKKNLIKNQESVIVDN